MDWVLAGCGVFSICGAVFDWEWFMTHRKAQFFVNILGRTGTRIFYAAFGIALLIGAATLDM